MKILSWNMRGINSDTKRVVIRKLIRAYKMEMVMIQETKKEEFSEQEVGNFWYDNEFNFEAAASSGKAGGLLSIWDKNKFELIDRVVNTRYILLYGKWIDDKVNSIWVNVYAPCGAIEQRALWLEFAELRNIWRQPWIMAGDFNAVISKMDRTGPINNVSGMDEFNNFIESCSLVEIPLVGRRFTWIGPGRRRSKIDMFLADEVWFQEKEDMVLQSLPRNVSDHIPLFLCNESINWGPRPFKLINAWLSKEGCLQMIKDTLGETKLQGKSLPVKLKTMKEALKKWNTSCENLNSKVSRLEKRINEIEILGDDVELDRALQEELKALKLELWDSLKCQEDLWRQKARMGWLKQGDLNTKMFHRAVKLRSKRNLIRCMNLGLGEVDEPKKIKQVIYDHFHKQFSVKKRKWDTILNLDFKRISEAEKITLENPFSLEEIKEAVWNCDEANAPGPDGFNIFFFKKCWEFVKEDLFKVLEKFHASGKLPNNSNSSFIALIAKTECPESISEYIPISLVSSVYKIVSKVLAKRLSSVMEKIISETQCTFIKGRQIVDGILVVNEVIHALQNEDNIRGEVALKIDFSKAYDCVRWDFLIMVLDRMRFGSKWCAWMLECVSTAKISIFINGSPTKEFKMCQGIRQGNPISPFLFIVVSEALSLLFKKAEECGLIEGIRNLVPQESITHLQFADDTVIFLRPCETYIVNIKRILRCFELCSGLSINFNKSCMVGVEVEIIKLHKLADLCGCKVGALPIKYLGFPLGAGPRRVSTWDPVIENFRKKLSGWKSRSLSLAGRIILINSVLSSLPLYYFFLFEVPKQVLLKMDKIRRSFLWGSWSGKKKISRVNWGRICSPKSKGGAGVINLKVKNRALLAKWGWRFITEKEALWRKIVKAKYGESNIGWISKCSRSSKASIIWRGIVNNMSNEKVSRWFAPNEIRWRLGNGETILFWEDRWCGDTPLSVSFPRLYKLVKDKGVTVAATIKNGDFRDLMLSNLFSRPLRLREMEAVAQVEARLMGQSVKNEVPDKVIWVHDQAGDFSVRKLTDLLVNADLEEPDFKFDLIWKMKVPPKVKNFLWMLKIKRIPTKAFLLEIGMNIKDQNFNCPWCGDELENLSHLFMDWLFARNYWKCFCNWWSIVWINTATIDELLTFCFLVSLTGSSRTLWFITIASALWSLWLARNEMVFRNKRISLKELLFYTKMRAWIWIKAVNEALILDDANWWKNTALCLEAKST